MEENPNAFKNFINAEVVKKISCAIISVYPVFPKKDFDKQAALLGPLELKARVLLITQKLKTTLPDPYSDALHILVKAMEAQDMRGFELWPFSEYISQFGLNDIEASLKAMVVLTQRFTAEFAVRPFLIQDHKYVLKFLLRLAGDENVHVRRWVSEGTRPLLPWGQKIVLFTKEPELTLPLLEKLRFDEELYVRKSVANHLNDISKHHPIKVIRTLETWSKSSPNVHREKIEWIKRHALRTLIKKGHPGALKLMGVGQAPKIKLKSFKLSGTKFGLNQDLSMSLEIQSESKVKQRLIVDYAIDFVKKNGSQGKKVFKLKTFELGPNSFVTITKNHKLRPITTMKFYSGTHHVQLQINGKVLATKKFYLEV